MTLSSLPRISPLVDRLVRLDTGGHWVVSCYLKLEPRDRVRRKYRIKFKNRAKARLTDLERLKLGRSERDLIERDLERVRAYLDEPGNLPTGRGVAVFASEPIGLFEAVTLPRVFRSRLVIDRTPLVRELAALADEFGLVVCAVYDRTSARFFQVTAFGIEELTTSPPAGRLAPVGSMVPVRLPDRDGGSLRPESTTTIRAFALRKNDTTRGSRSVCSICRARCPTGGSFWPGSVGMRRRWSHTSIPTFGSAYWVRRD